MDKKNILFIFLISSVFMFNFVSAVNMTYDTTANFSLQDLGDDGIFTFTIKNYFTGPYDSVNILYYYDNTTKSIISHFGDLEYCDSNQIRTCIVPYSNDFLIRLTSLGYNNTFEYYVIVYNQSDWSPTTTGFYGVDYSSIIFDVSTNYSIASDPLVLQDSPSFISQLTSVFLLIFPDKEDLTPTSRFGFVFITLLLNSIVLYVLIYTATKDISSISHIIVFSVNLVLVCFFIAIGYIPIILLLLFALVLLFLGWFKLKNV